MQHLFHFFQPRIMGPEKRHLFDSEERNPRINEFRNLSTGEMIEERKGVHHIIQCWMAQGNPNVSRPFAFICSFWEKKHWLLQVLCPGGMYAYSNKGRLAIEHYYIASSPIARILVEYFKVLFPKAYEKSKQAFSAGRWIQGDPGPWLGRALIYKLGQFARGRQGRGANGLFPLWTFYWRGDDRSRIWCEIQVSNSQAASAPSSSQRTSQKRSWRKSPKIGLLTSGSDSILLLSSDFLSCYFLHFVFVVAMQILFPSSIHVCRGSPSSFAHLTSPLKWAN